MSGISSTSEGMSPSNEFIILSSSILIKSSRFNSAGSVLDGKSISNDKLSSSWDSSRPSSSADDSMLYVSEDDETSMNSGSGSQISCNVELLFELLDLF